MTEVTKELAHLVQMIDEARQEGYDEGHKAGYDEGETAAEHWAERDAIARRDWEEEHNHWLQFDVERGAISPEFVTVALVGL